MTEKNKFMPGLMVIIRGRPHRAMACPMAAEEACAPGDIILVKDGRVHRMQVVPFTLGHMATAPTLDDEPWPGDDDIPAPRPSVIRDVAEFTKPITTE